MHNEAKKLIDKMNSKELLEYCYQYGVTHNPAGSDEEFKTAIIESLADENEASHFCDCFDDFKAYCKHYHGQDMVGEAERKATIQNKEVKTIDDILEQDKPENGGMGILEEEATPAPSLMKTDKEIIDYALSFLSTNLTEFEVMQLTGCDARSPDKVKNDFYKTRDDLRTRISELRAVN